MMQAGTSTSSSFSDIYSLPEPKDRWNFFNAIGYAAD
jgi:hypothetical protein